jgi:hypothetical protein
VAGFALAALTAALPALPAAWASLAAPGAVVGSSASAGGGTVTVTRCSRGFLLASWHCQGTFAYSDPMAQGSRVTVDVVLANDPRHYGRGARVGASLLAGTHRAYRWGGLYAAGVLVLVPGLVLCAFLAGMLLLTRRRVPVWLGGGVLALGIACLSPALAGLWPITASIPSPSPAGAATAATPAAASPAAR